MKMLRLDAVKMMRNAILTVKIERLSELQLRIKLGLFLIKCAVWVMNCNLKVEDMTEEEINDTTNCSPTSL